VSLLPARHRPAGDGQSLTLQVRGRSSTWQEGAWHAQKTEDNRRQVTYRALYPVRSLRAGASPEEFSSMAISDLEPPVVDAEGPSAPVTSAPPHCGYHVHAARMPWAPAPGGPASKSSAGALQVGRGQGGLSMCGTIKVSARTWAT